MILMEMRMEKEEQENGFMAEYSVGFYGVENPGKSYDWIDSIFIMSTLMSRRSFFAQIFKVAAATQNNGVDIEVDFWGIKSN